MTWHSVGFMTKECQWEDHIDWPGHAAHSARCACSHCACNSTQRQRRRIQARSPGA